MLLIKNIKTYSPSYLGAVDILVGGGKILKIGKIEKTEYMKEIDGTNKICIPGIIDGHVHLIGGGGEDGYKTRIKEIKYSDMVKSGVTTVVGLLGTDGTTRNIEGLVAKTKAINEMGLNAFCLTGSYEHPSPTLTGSLKRDILFIKEIIGTKIAIGEKRAGFINDFQLANLGSINETCGKQSHKSGIICVHIGMLTKNLDNIMNIVKEYNLEPTVFIPTHMNRNKELIISGAKYTKMGGYIDLTANSKMAIKEVIDIFNEEKGDLSHITISSDAQGSYGIRDENGNFLGLGIAHVSSIFEEVKTLILKENYPLHMAIKFITSNVADYLKLNSKGYIKENYDGDLLLLDKDLNINTTIAGGEIHMENYKLLKTDIWYE